MTKILHKLSLLFILFTIGTIAKADTKELFSTNVINSSFDNSATSIHWAFNSSSDVAPTATPDGAFSLFTVSNGTSLSENGSEAATAGDNNGITFIKYKVVSKQSSREATSYVEWKVKPTKGITFKPTKVSAHIARFGTDGGIIDIAVRNAEGTETILKEGIIPARANKSQADDKHGAEEAYASSFELDVPASLATTQDFSLVIYLYGMDAGKNAGFSDVKIIGTVNGTAEQVEQFTLTATPMPTDGGTVTITPKADKYDSGTEIKLTATPNFGYHFINWTDGDNNVVSTEATFTHTLTKNIDLIANYQSVNTYELILNTTEGAQDYMVNLNPAPHMDGNKKMYEEGTTVTLTANNNKILTFTSWSDGTTANTNTVTMNSNQTITANYQATDYIAAWDFYKRGNNGRNADFYANDDNASAALTLRLEDGTTTGWLDKSFEAAGGYEGRNAAVNWQTFNRSNNYYYQIWVNASEYKDIKVSAEMLLNYNAYTVQKVQYSLDDKEWKDLGTITLAEVKTWTEGEFTLPSEANYMPKVYIRWIPDYNSSVAGASSEKDGTSIANIFVFGTSSIQDDGKAPELVSTVPAEGSSSASATGKIVLTFNEKIQLTDNAKATLNGESISISVVGKTLTASYKGLPYNKEQVFTLEGGSVSDLTNNVLNDPITIHFTTMNRPTVNKMIYNKVVSTVEEFKEALNIANSIKDKGTSYRIFMHNGTYDLGQETLTTTSGWNVSLIGESMDGVVIVNHPTQEGIGVTATLLNTGENLYMQDITLKNAYDYVGTTGRAVCLQDRGNKTIAKRVKLLSYQDTYYSNSRSRFYWEDSELHGTVDYLCGEGDVYYNRCLLYMEDRTSGDVIAAPSDKLKYGYVFLDCTIDGADSQKGKYNLARPWHSGCCAQFINTTMNILPTAAGYTEMGDDGVPDIFAEYNSMTATGSVVDLSGRKTKYIYNNGDLVLEPKHSPILSKEEADALSIDNVMGGTDGWDPRVVTEQAEAPANVKLEGTTLSWDNNDYVLCWAICKDGAVIDFTTKNEYTVSDTSGKYSVRAANEKGGLGEAAEANSSSGIEEIKANDVVNTTYYNTAGSRVDAKAKGVIIEVKTLKDGKRQSTKILK